jgi:23S rRNA A2030 N6-methylase RlmJ
MSWRSLEDPDNPENRNAGNGGDLIKHTVYLTALRWLAQRPAWQRRMRLRECHAGRGIYRVPPSDPRRELLERLRNSSTLLAAAQRDCLHALGLQQEERHDWYAGSGLLNAWATRDVACEHDAYEWDPSTRRILVAARAAAGFTGAAIAQAGADAHFDGETHIAEHVGGWDERDVMLLDPFGLWIHAKHGERRARYRRIVDGVLRRGQRAPCMLMFWTWGGAHDRAEADIEGHGPAVEDGYQPLAASLHAGGHLPIVVRWRTGLSFAMWVIVPLSERDELRRELTQSCTQLLDALGVDLDLQVR